MTTSVSSSTSTTATTTPVADSASIGSALATALGGGTGVDMTQLAGNLAQAEFGGKLSTLDNQATKVATEISQATQLKSDLLALSTSIGALVRGGSLASTPTVANAAVATATLPAGSSGAAASYSLEVSSLASPQVLNSPAYTAATSTTGSGTLTLHFGTVAGSAFTEDTAHASVDISIAQGASLSDVATAINAKGAGVTAYVANGSDGAHLVLKGQQGAANGFTLTASENSADPGLATLAWTPAAGATGRIAVSASDAQFKLDGISRTAPGNSIDNVAPGLSLKLTGTNVGAPTSINFSDPVAGISSAMQDLTSALNSLVSEVHTDLDPANGGLSQDSATRSIQRQLTQLTSLTVMPNAASGDPRTLSDLGLSADKDGNFSLDTSKLNTVLAAKPTAVAAMFTTGLYGVYGTFDNMTRTMTSASDPGSITGALTKYTNLKTTLADRRTKFTTQQDALRARLVKQFASANANVATSKSTLSYVQNQIAAWNKTG